jgi:hypothetical protein
MIDTHAYYSALKDAGFKDQQADAMTKGLATVMLGTLATKTDLADARIEIAGVRTEVAGVRTELAGLRAEFKADLGVQGAKIASIEAQMQLMQRSIGFLATYTTLIVGVATVINHFIK